MQAGIKYACKMPIHVVNKESTIHVQCAPYRARLSPVKFLYPHALQLQQKTREGVFHL
jgi:hypothetical protein